MKHLKGILESTRLESTGEGDEADVRSFFGDASIPKILLDPASLSPGAKEDAAASASAQPLRSAECQAINALYEPS